MLLEWRLKIRNFIKKHKNKIIIILVVWIIILIINYLLANRQEEVTLNTTYTPHEVLLNSDVEVSEDLGNEIEDLIDDYINKCINKDFSGAFELLTDDCKTYVFGDSLDNFTEYAEGIFPNQKRYSIQDYSNTSDYYIYQVKIIDDIITTGLTNQTYAYYEEKWAIKENGDSLQLCVNDYMGYEELKEISEDDYMKIRIENRLKYYQSEIYTVRITNKTEYTAVLFDAVAGNEVLLTVGENTRSPSEISNSMILEPGETRTFTITFSKYYDESSTSESIIFNKVRLMSNYTGEEETEEEETEKAEKVYSITVPIQ